MKKRFLKFRRDLARDRVIDAGRKLRIAEAIRSESYGLDHEQDALFDAEVDRLTRKRDRAIEFIKKTAQEGNDVRN
jgi:hypothetical protein